MLPSLQFPLASVRRRSSNTPVAWFYWLRALLTLLVLFTASSSAWSQACVTWTATSAQLSGGSYRYTLPLNDACDPTAEGLYTSPGQIVGTALAADGSSLSVDLGTFPYDILVFTPKLGTTQTSWTFTLYRASDAPVTVAINFPVPTVTSLSPSGGPNSGGTAVTITGTGFTGATGVNFGATPGTGVVVLTDTTIVATSPAGTSPVDVTVTTSAGTSAINAPNDRFTYTPTVTGVSPTSGPAGGGVSATITGTGFTNATSVTFGTNAALPYIIVSDSTITVSNVPAGTGTVDVKVTNSAGTSATNASDRFTYLAAPVVTSVTPNAGAPGGGASVRIQGSGFSTGGVPSVKFGSTPAPSFTLDNDAQITVTSPAAAAGTIDVTVTNNNGTSATSAADQFTYAGVPTVTSLGTKEGPLAGGTTVTINGTGLKTTTAVAFGAVSVPFTAVSDTQITVTSPANASAGVVDIVVTTQGAPARPAAPISSRTWPCPR